MPNTESTLQTIDNGWHITKHRVAQSFIHAEMWGEGSLGVAQEDRLVHKGLGETAKAKNSSTTNSGQILLLLFPQLFVPV